MDKNNYTINGLNELNDDEFNLDLNNNDEDDLLLLKVKEPPSQLTSKSTNNCQIESNQKNDEEDEEDEIIKSQALFEATNSTSKNVVNSNNKLLSVRSKKDNVRKIKLFPIINISIFLVYSIKLKEQIKDLDCSITMSTQTSLELLAKSNTNKKEIIDDENNVCWDYSLDDLSKRFKNLGLQSDIIVKFKMEYYFKKVI